MVQQRTLGRAGRAGRVLDLRRVVRRDLGQVEARAGRNATNASQSSSLTTSRRPGSPGRTSATHSAIGLPRKPSTMEQARRARLAEHVLELARAVCRVDRHEHEAREPRAEFEQHPFREVRRVDGDVLAGLEAREQRARRSLGIAQQLRVGPRAALAGQLAPGDDRRAPAGSGSRLAQDRSDRRLQHWHGSVRRPVGPLQWLHYVYPLPAVRRALLVRRPDLVALKNSRLRRKLRDRGATILDSSTARS